MPSIVEIWEGSSLLCLRQVLPDKHQGLLVHQRHSVHQHLLVHQLLSIHQSYFGDICYSYQIIVVMSFVLKLLMCTNLQAHLSLERKLLLHLYSNIQDLLDVISSYITRRATFYSYINLITQYVRVCIPVSKVLSMFCILCL